MIKNLLFGLILPCLLVAVGIGVFLLMKRPEPDKLPELGSDPASLLSAMPAADVQPVRALAELSETLDIPVNGTVVPFREIELAAEAAGKIVEVSENVRSGNFVKQGQLLLKIDPRDYELDVQRLTRRRDQELASLEELKQDLQNAQLLIEVAEEEFALAEAEVGRLQSLGQNITSAAELDQAKRSRLASMNQRVTLQNQLRTYQARQARLELAAKLAETELEQAQLNLQRTVVRAPVDGRIVSEQVEKDSYVQRGTPLLTIEDTEKVEVAVNLRMDQLYWILDQSDLSADQLVNAAQAARYELPQIPVDVHFHLAGRESLTYQWQGVLSRYDGAGLDPQSRTIPVRIVVDAPQDFLINGQKASESSRSGPPTLVRGMFVDVIIKARPATRLLLVPKLGIKPATQANRIWKFVPDQQAFEVVKRRNGLDAQNDQPADAVVTSVADKALDAENANASSRQQTLEPKEWQAGFLQVLDGVQVVGEFDAVAAGLPPQDAEAPTADGGPAIASAPIEYWICEVGGSNLSAGDLVITTPLPGMEGTGQDTVRVPLSQVSAQGVSGG